MSSYSACSIMPTDCARNTQYVTDIYFAYLQRSPDADEFDAGLVLLEKSREDLRASIAEGHEFLGLAMRLYGLNASEIVRALVFFEHLYLGALGRLPTPTESSTLIARVNTAAAQGQGQVVTEVKNIGRETFTSAEYLAKGTTNAQYVTDLFAGLLQRAQGDEVVFWMPGAGARLNMLNLFLDRAEYQTLASALYREVFWLVADQLGTPRMILDRTGSLAAVKRHDYLPFGEELLAIQGLRTTELGYTADTTRQRFTSKEPNTKRRPSSATTRRCKLPSTTLPASALPRVAAPSDFPPLFHRKPSKGMQRTVCNPALS